MSPRAEAAREAFFKKLQIDPGTRARLKSAKYEAAWERATAAVIQLCAQEALKLPDGTTSHSGAIDETDCAWP